MDSARSLPQVPDGLARQRSAEDLDAAQQLISSAQAGREHLGDRHREENVRAPESDSARNAHFTNTAAVNGSSHWAESSHGERRVEKTSPKSQKDTSFLGHSCRSVLHCTLSRYILTL